MSWAGLKKGVSRAGTTLLQKTGQVDRTVDPQFQEEVERFKLLEKNANNLQKHSKLYLDSLRGMTGAQLRISETIDHFYNDAFTGGQATDEMAGHSYKRAIEELEGKTRDQLDAPYRQTVLEPIGKLCSYFPEINNSIQKRNKKLLDYDSARTRMRKLQEKPNDDPAKFSRTEKETEEARVIFETINSQLQVEVPQMVDLRVPYLDPSFEAMVRIQLKFAEDSYERLSGVQRYLQDNVRDDYAEGRLDAQVEGALQEMRDLSICGLSG
ncbi:BAR-domain-containing protein [Atractiella rhizophila]|nr:BAR-domain-containing protein [Atractiella rhizophila]